MIPYDSPKGLAAFLAERGLALKKRFGQNFLVSPGVRDRILRVLDPGKNDFVWEIGPGLGCMTLPILESGARLRVFEIDRGFIAILEAEFGARENFLLTPGDAVKTWRDLRDEKPDKVFGNLPYASAAALIADFLEEGFAPERCVFMVQREVARRMAARPGSKDYSSFSLLCRSFAEVETRFDAAPGSFYPPPEVVSTVVELRPKIPGPAIADRRLYLDLLRALFASRRKTVRNNLLRFAAETGRNPDWAAFVLAAAGIDPGARGEDLDVGDMAGLANAAAGRDGLPPGPG